VQDLTEDIVKEPEVLGVQVVGTTDLKIRIIAECKPTRQFNVTRLLNIEIKKRLDSVQIETM
jgi:small-conductance mechanosensitive channel